MPKNSTALADVKRAFNVQDAKNFFRAWTAAKVAEHRARYRAELLARMTRNHEKESQR